MQTLADLRTRLTPAEVANDMAVQFRFHPAFFRELVRSSSGQTIIFTIAVLVLGRLLKQVLGRRPSRARTVSSRNT